MMVVDTPARPCWSVSTVRQAIQTKAHVWLLGFVRVKLWTATDCRLCCVADLCGHCRNAPLWMEWAMMEWDAAGNYDRARQLFQQGASVPGSYQHPPLYQAWAERETAAGNAEAAAWLRGRFREVAQAEQRPVRGVGP